MKFLFSTLLSGASAMCLLGATPSIAVDRNVACVGNSITYGYDLPWKEDYPTKLDSILGDGYAVSNFGVSSKTMVRKSNETYWSQSAFGNALASKPDHVIIELGTNDSKTLIWQTYGKDFKKDYRAMVDTFRTLASKPMVWITLQPWANNPGWTMYDTVIARRVNPLIREVALEAGTPLIDLRAGFAGHPEWYQSDSVHPNVVGAKALAKMVGNMLQHSPLTILRPLSGGALLAPQGYGYQWYRNDSMLVGDTARELKSKVYGSYKVSVKFEQNSESRLVTAAAVSTGVQPRLRAGIVVRVGMSGRIEAFGPSTFGALSVSVREARGQAVSASERLRPGVYHYDVVGRDLQQQGRIVVLP